MEERRALGDREGDPSLERTDLYLPYPRLPCFDTLHFDTLHEVC